MTGQQRVHPLAEGAFMALLTAFMGALAIYFLPVKFLFDFAWVIPVIIIIRRHNLRTGLLTMVTAYILTWLFTEPASAALLFVELGPLALAYGLLFKYQTSPGQTMAAGIVVSALAAVVLILILLYIEPASVFPSEQLLRQQAERVASFYTNAGLLGIEDAKMYANMSVALSRIFIPGFLILSAVIRGVISYILAVRVLRRLSYRIAPLPPFSEWRLPWYSVWLLITGLGMAVAGDQFNWRGISLTGKIAVFSVAPVFFVIGLAVITYFFKTWKIPTWSKILLGIIAVINPTGSIILFILIGIFDPLVSFRRRFSSKE